MNGHQRTLADFELPSPELAMNEGAPAPAELAGEDAVLVPVEPVVDADLDNFDPIEDYLYNDCRKSRAWLQREIDKLAEDDNDTEAKA